MQRLNQTRKKKDLTPIALTSIRGVIHRTIKSLQFQDPSTSWMMVSFCKQNKILEVVWRKSYYRRRNPKRKNKSPIEAGDMEKVKSHFKNFFGSICAIIWAREKGKVGKNSQRTHRNSSKTIQRICHHKVHRTVQELPKWHSTEG